MSVFPLQKDGTLAPADTLFQGSATGPDAIRQATPHIHCTVFSPDGKYIFATDFSAVGRDVEVAGMDAGGLITYLCQGSIFGIHGKDGDAVFFQTVTGVEVFPIRTLGRYS